VTLANGDWVASLVVCKAVHVHIGGEEFVFNFFVILLDGYNMVLGVNWLRTLGPIVWDFERGRMPFWWGNHYVMLQGTTSCPRTPAAKAISVVNLLQLLLE
jgi:hypothetical protein